MKVIGAKSLVQIAPSVTEVGERPSPGVFDFNRGGPPLISCEGAGQITGIAIGYYVPDGGNQDTWIVAEQVRLKFNNEERFIILDGATPPYTSEYPEIGAFFNQHLSGANGDFNQAPFEGEISFWQNIDPLNPVRFEYELLPTNQTQFRVATFGDNPAHENVTPIFTRACFAPYVSPISCAGAESTVEMAFAIKDGAGVPLNVSFLLDNNPVDLMNNPPPYITKEILSKTYDGEVPAGFSVGAGVLKFTNTDSVPHRIECFKNDFQNIRVLANHNPTVINLDYDFAWVDVGVCLSPSTGKLGYFTTFEIAEVSSNPNKTINLTIDGVSFANLPLLPDGDTLWDDVPVTVNLGPDGTSLNIGSIGVEPINSLSISSPDFRLISFPDSDLLPNASSNSTTGEDIGNTGHTKFTEFVGESDASNYIIVAKEWITGIGQRSVGVSDYLKNGNSGQAVKAGWLGQHFNTVDDAVTFFTTFQSSAMDGKTVSEYCQLGFDKLPDGNMQISSLSGTEMTVLLSNYDGDFMNVLADDSPNKSSARLRNFDQATVVRLGIPS